MKGRGQKLLQGSNLDCSVSLTNPRNSHDMHETCNNLYKKSLFQQNLTMNYTMQFQHEFLDWKPTRTNDRILR